jgi:hypothetical protein
LLSALSPCALKYLIEFQPLAIGPENVEVLAAFVPERGQKNRFAFYYLKVFAF